MVLEADIRIDGRTNGKRTAEIKTYEPFNSQRLRAKHTEVEKYVVN